MHMLIRRLVLSIFRYDREAVAASILGEPCLCETLPSSPVCECGILCLDHYSFHHSKYRFVVQMIHTSTSTRC